MASGTGNVSPNGSNPNLNRFDEILRVQKLGSTALTKVNLELANEKQIESIAAGMAMDKMEGYDGLANKAKEKGFVDANGNGDIAAYKKSVSYKLGNALKIGGKVAVVGGAFMVGSFAGAGVALAAMGMIKPAAKAYKQNKAFKEYYDEAMQSLADGEGKANFENIVGAEDIKKRMLVAAGENAEGRKELIRDGEEFKVVENKLPEIDRNANGKKGKKTRDAYNGYLDYLERIAQIEVNKTDEEIDKLTSSKQRKAAREKNKKNDGEIEKARNALERGYISELDENIDKITEDLRGVFAGDNAVKNGEHGQAKDAIERYLRENLKEINAKVDVGLGVSEKKILTLSEKATLRYGAMLGAGVGLATSLAKMNGRKELSSVFGGSTLVGAAIAGAIGAIGGGINKRNILNKDNARQALSGQDGRKIDVKGEEDKTSYEMLNVEKVTEKLNSYFKDGKLPDDLDDAKIHEIKEIIVDFKARNKVQNEKNIALLSYNKRDNIEKSRLEVLTAIARMNKTLRPKVDKYDDVIEQMVMDKVEVIKNSMEETRAQQRKAIFGAAVKTGLVSGGIALAVGAGLKGLMENETVAGKMADLEKWRQGQVDSAKTWAAGILGLNEKTADVVTQQSATSGEKLNIEKNFEANKNGKNVIFADMDNDGKPEVYLDTNHDGVLDSNDFDAKSFSMDVNGDGKVDIEDLKVSDGLRIDEKGRISEADLRELNGNLKRFGYGIKGEEIELGTTHEEMQSRSIGEYLKSDNIKTATFERRVWHDGAGVSMSTLRGVDYDGDGTFDAWRINVGGVEEMGDAQVALTLKDELGMKTVQMLDIQNGAEGSYVDVPMGLATYRNGSENMGKLLAEYAEVVKIGDNGVMDVYSTISGSGAIGDTVRTVASVADKGLSYDFCKLNDDGSFGESFGALNIAEVFKGVENFIDNKAFDDASREQMHYTEKTVMVGGETVRDVDVTEYNPKTDQYYAYDGSGENGELYAAADITKNKITHFGLANNIKTDAAGNIINQAEVVQQQINGIATTPEIALTYATSEGTWCDEAFIEAEVAKGLGLNDIDIPGLDGVIDTQDEFNIVTDLMRDSDNGLHVAIANRTIDEHLNLLDGGRLALEKIGTHKTAYSYFGTGNDVNVNLGTTKYTTEEILVGYDKNGERVTNGGTMGLILGEKDGATDGWGRWCGSQPKKVVTSDGSENSENSETSENDESVRSDGSENSEDSENSENSEASEADETTGSDDSESSESSETSENKESTDSDGSENSENSETSENEESGSENSEDSETSETTEVQGKDAANEQRIVEQAPLQGEVTPTNHEAYTSDGETPQPVYTEPVYEEIVNTQVAGSADDIASQAAADENAAEYVQKALENGAATTKEEAGDYVDDILNELLNRQQ